MILDGKYFEIVSIDGDKVVAKCVSCINKTIIVGLSSTSNFRLHLKVCICKNDAVRKRSREELQGPNKKKFKQSALPAKDQLHPCPSILLTAL